MGMDRGIGGEDRDDARLPGGETAAPASGARTSGGASTATRPTGLPTAVDPPCRRRSPLQPGELVAGRYRVEDVIGRGGMGAVFAATHTITGKRVALKVLHALPGHEDVASRRLEHEARAAGLARHPNVVDVIDVVVREDGGRALVMERCEGESLQRRLDREGRLTVGEACALFLGVVAGLRAVHAAGVVHRDLKPDNVFLASEAHGAVVPKLLDFGIAHLPAGSAVDAAIDAGEPMGTPWYMAPEQALCEPDVDARADCFALGVLLYRVLTGSLPTRGRTLAETLLALFKVPITPVEHLAPEVPADVARVVRELLVLAREDRLADLRRVEAVLAAHADPASLARGRVLRLPCERGCRSCTRAAANACGDLRRAG
jgi:serine/threonine-protein kinase